MALSVIIMAYREAENLAILLPDIIDNANKATDDFEILVIDSPNSNDNTKEICEKFGVRYILQEKPSYAGAFQTGVKYASKDVFLMMDADFSHPPKIIPELYNTFVGGKYDVGIGSRYVNGGISDDLKRNKVFSKVLNFVYRKMFGLENIGDISSGYKMYLTQMLKDMQIMSKFFEVHIEILVKLKLVKANLKIIEIPINFQKRLKGVSKRNDLTFLPQFGILLIRLFLYKLFYKN